MRKLKSYLQEKKLSQAEFGMQIGVSQVAVNRYLRGLRFPEPEIVVKIADATDGTIVPADWYDDLYPRPSKQETAA